MLFETPLTEKLTEDDGKALFDRFQALLGAYERGELPPSRVANIRARHRVDHKVRTIRNARKS
jgi:hypothetical protein